MMKKTLLSLSAAAAALPASDKLPSGMPHPRIQELAGQAAPGWLGMWHGQTPQQDEFAYKYSGGLGTYCAKHRSQAIHVPEQRKTWFVVGGTLPGSERRDLHMRTGEHQARLTRFGPEQLVYLIGCFDHERGLVSRPTVVYDKWCGDPHDNPVLSIDADGYLWVLGPSHGAYTTESFISRSVRPYDHTAFTHTHTKLFAYPQPWMTDHGFAHVHTRYADHQRGLWFSGGPDPLTITHSVKLAHIERGGYQVSAHRGTRIGVIQNMHPQKGGLEARRNLYYLQSEDGGHSWTTATGEPLRLPLTEERNPALVFDTEAAGDLVYLKDLQFDADGRPCALFVTSTHNLSGPKGGERIWWFARFDGSGWQRHRVTSSDHNYDMGTLSLRPDGTWRLLAPTDPGPQPWNAGGEMVLFQSSADGSSWRRLGQVTSDSQQNHSYARSPLQAADEFMWFWADGDARNISLSYLYCADVEGRAYRLPERMDAEWARPIPLE